MASGIPPGVVRAKGFVTFAEMKSRPRPHPRSCYTSSICLVGSAPGEDRELMVLFVVDEPIEVVVRRVAAAVVVVRHGEGFEAIPDEIPRARGVERAPEPLLVAEASVVRRHRRGVVHQRRRCRALVVGGG